MSRSPTPTDSSDATQTERDQIFAWRLEELLRAGYGPEAANFPGSAVLPSNDRPFIAPNVERREDRGGPGRPPTSRSNTSPGRSSADTSSSSSRLARVRSIVCGSPLFVAFLFEVQILAPHAAAGAERRSWWRKTMPSKPRAGLLEGAEDGFVDVGSLGVCDRQGNPLANVPDPRQRRAGSGSMTRGDGGSGLVRC